MKTNDLAEIEAIYKCGSFSVAAEQLGVTQPTLSMRIKRLEEQLSCMIFDRTDGMKLTEEGKIVLEYARQRKWLEVDLRRQLQDSKQKELTGTLTIGSAHGFTAGFLPMVLSKFHNRYPKVTIKLFDGEMAEMAERMRRGELDVLIDTMNNNSDEFNNEMIFLGEIYLCVPSLLCEGMDLRKYQITKKMLEETSLGENPFPAVKLEWFASCPFILLSEKSFLGKLSRSILYRAGIDHNNVKLMSNQMVTSFAMSQHGMGISFVTEDFVRYGASGFPPIFRIDDVENERKVCVSYVKQRYLSKEINAFLNIIKES